MQLSNFGEQFAASVLSKTYQSAVYNGIVNREYEGEIQKPGDRVNILSFLNSILLSDYVVGTDMSSETIVDAEDSLVVEKRKYYNFSLDRLEDLFTYAGNIPEHLINDASEVLARSQDQYVLYKFGEEVKAGNWVGVDLVVVGNGQTMASIVTTATGGTVTLNATSNTYEGQVGSVENPRDGGTYHGGFISPADLYKGFRLRSTAAFVSPWYRISGITSTVQATLTEWDEETSGSDFEEGYTLRGLFGGDGTNFPKYGDGNASLLTMSSLGWEIQAAIATTVTASNIYDQVTLMAQVLDENEVAPERRHLTVPPAIITQLRQSSEMQPTGIAEIYTGTVINGRAMRVGAFDVHSAAGARVSTRAGHSTATNTGPDTDTVPVTGTSGYLLAANHVGFMTFADKWSESRVVDAENQFAKKYQGLYLYGAKVPRYRRKYGAILFGTVPTSINH